MLISYTVLTLVLQKVFFSENIFLILWLWSTWALKFGAYICCFLVGRYNPVYGEGMVLLCSLLIITLITFYFNDISIKMSIKKVITDGL